MGIHIRVTCAAILDAVANIRQQVDLPQGKTILQLCPQAHSIHYVHGEPVGLLIDLVEAAATGFDFRSNLRLVDPDVMRFGKSYSLFEPNRRTIVGRDLGQAFDALRHTSYVARYTLSLIAPRIRHRLALEEFGFDYIANSQVYVLQHAIFICIPGVTILRQGFDEGSGVELIGRDEYRAAVLQSRDAVPVLLFNDQDSLVVRAQQALAPFIDLPVSTVNRMLTDIYQRILTDAKDVRFYVNMVLLPEEQTYIFASLVAILHAFYGVE